MTAIANGCRRGTRGTMSKRDAEKEQAEQAEQADRDQELGQLVRSNAFRISSRRCRRRREL